MKRHLTEAAVVAATAVVSLVGMFAEYDKATGPVPPLYGAIVLTVVPVALMPLRHRAAFTTGVAILVLCLAYRLIGYTGLALAAPLYPVCYTIVGRHSVVVASLVALGVPVIALIPPEGVNLDALGGIVVLLVATIVMAEARRTWTHAAEEESDRRIMAERLTIARELHDVLAHTITVISVQAAAGLDALPGRPTDTESALRTIRAAAKDAMTELRSTLRVLREDPTTPAPQPRLDQLPHLVELARSAGLDVDITTTGAPLDLPIGTELAAYRIVQEALTNVIRHAHATTATVRVDHQPGALLVTVTDNGTAAPNEHGAGHGMIGMRERVRAVGGTFEAGPAPGGGFVVTARLDVGAAR